MPAKARLKRGEATVNEEYRKARWRRIARAHQATIGVQLLPLLQAEVARPKFNRAMGTIRLI